MARKDLVNKLKRRKLYINKFKGERPKDKMDKSDEVLNKSPRSFKLLRGIERKLDANFGNKLIPSPMKIKLERLLNINDVDRFDFDPGVGTDFGIRLRLDPMVTPEKEATEITTSADTGALEQFTAVAVADVAGSLNSTYFTFSSALDETMYYVWYNINSAGVDPAVPSATGIEVAGATGASASTLGGATRSAITAAAGTDFTVSGSGANIVVKNKKLGNSTDAADGAAPTGFAITVDTQGVNSNLQNKYFFISSPNTDYYVWLNVNSQGVDPAQTGSPLPVALTAGSSNSQVATAIAAVLDAVDFDSSALANVITATDEDFGAVVDAHDGNSGFNFNVTTQGVNASPELFQEVGIQVNDVIEFLEGELNGKKLLVTDLIDADTLRLEDVSSYTGPETEISVKVQITGNKTSFV